MTSADQLDWLRLVLVPGLGPVAIDKLRASFGAPSDILDAPPEKLLDAGVSREIIDALHAPDEQRLEASLSWLDASTSHSLLTIDDPDYPLLLRDIHSAPAVLFTNGDASLLSQLQLAIVGSRNPTAQGRENAYEFARYLSRSGLVITSGLALGIDAASHLGALDANGATIAVTGNGLDRVYPARHKELAHRIADSGLLISEFPPGTKPLPANFPRRNRTISGLSLGTLVVEAAQKSGSLITAYKALEHSREVFAIPGSIHNPLARGCHQLIRQGAKLVETAQDILEELAPIAHAAIPDEQQSETRTVDNHPGQTHQEILDAMAFDPVSIDMLAQRTDKSIKELSSILLILELEDKVTAQPGGYYVRNAQA